MKLVLLLAVLATSLLDVARAFQQPSPPTTATPAADVSDRGSLSRKSFLDTLPVVAGGVGVVLAGYSQPASARGRATLEKAYQRYTPRIVAGSKFYGTDLRKLVERSDWAGIKDALQDPPGRTKEDLNKPDAGVSERAKLAGGFSDAKVVVAADLFAGAFSDNSISTKTKKMKAAVDDLRGAVEGMSSTAKLALGEEKSGGLFGLGAKKPSESELAKQLRDFYVQGGNAMNAYIYAANEDLAMQFDRLPFVGA